MTLKGLKKSAMRDIKKVIVHVSDTPDDKHFDVEDITKWHKEKGWATCGYHYVVTRVGEVQEGRPIIRPGAHTQGHNHDSIGVCWIGRTNPTPRQYKALKSIIAQILYTFKLDTTALFGHNEFNANKTCPNISVEKLKLDVEPWLEDLQPKKS